MNLTQERFSLLVLCSLLMLSAAVAHAQVTTADLVGTIRDTSGAIVPGVTVVLTNEATGVDRTVTTGAAGTYIFTSLQPGRYRLTAEIQGFRKVERTGVELQVNQRAAIDLELEVGLISETVTIAGTAPLLETQSSVLGTVIEEKQVQDLPLSGRNFVQLATLSPGRVGRGHRHARHHHERHQARRLCDPAPNCSSTATGKTRTTTSSTGSTTTPG